MQKFDHTQEIGGTMQNILMVLNLHELSYLFPYILEESVDRFREVHPDVLHMKLILRKCVVTLVNQSL